MAIPKVDIQAHGSDISVSVDGHDLTGRVSFIGFQVEAGKTVPIVTLGLRAEVSLSGDMGVEFVDPGTFPALLSAFLDQVKLTEFEESFLESEIIDQPNGTILAMFQKLKELANAD